jgi:hydrogenase maturation factor HypF (carbamoyltransferase family)
MGPRCEAEYRDPSARRFHAETASLRQCADVRQGRIRLRCGFW